MSGSVKELLEEKKSRKQERAFADEYRGRLNAELNKNGFISFEDAIAYMEFIEELFGRDKNALVDTINTLKTFTDLVREKGLAPPSKKVVGSKPVKLFFGITWHKEIEDSIPGGWEIPIAARQRDYGHELYPELKAGVTLDGLTDMYILQENDASRGGHQTITDRGIRDRVNEWVAEHVEELGLNWPTES